MFGLSTTGSCALILSASVGYLITESTYHVVAGIAVVPALVLIADIAQAIDNYRLQRLVSRRRRR